MKSVQRISIAFSLLLVALMFGGCSSSGCGCNSGNGLFGTNFLQDQPIRSTVGSWFQGDSVDTCNTPAGQLSQPVCSTCVGGGVSGFGSGQFSAPQVQPLYGAPTINGSQPGFSGQFAPQPGPAVGAVTNAINNLGSGTVGSLATPPSL